MSDKKPVFKPNKEFAKNANIKNMCEYHDLQDKAMEDYEGFWGDAAKEKIDWIEPFDNVLDESNAAFETWFDGGKLNVSAKCIDSNLEMRKNKAAIIFEYDRVDFKNITYLNLFKPLNSYDKLLQ